MIPEVFDRLRREIAGVMTNPLRVAGVTCAICTREVDSGYQLCFRCRADRSQFEVPARFGPPDHLTSDLVVPLTYAVLGHQAYLDMFNTRMSCHSRPLSGDLSCSPGCSS